MNANTILTVNQLDTAANKEVSFGDLINLFDLTHMFTQKQIVNSYRALMRSVDTLKQKVIFSESRVQYLLNHCEKQQFQLWFNNQTCSSPQSKNKQIINNQNNQSNTEQSKPKSSQQNQSQKNQIKGLVKSFNKILNGNQKPKANSFTEQQNHNSSTKQRATTDQNPYIYIKQCEMNNYFDRKQQNKNNDAYKKNQKKYSWNQADVVQKLTKVLQKTLKQQGNCFDRNNNNQGKLFNSINQ
ncbi:Hypothetical_protein [Hexamita inflata]|uniref:Hypothetical_protein n=1 Tax=Hexamita inflata TaxID=28002 RepID=A0AA86RDR2_9EUKA|nr:Hypothetical protein HINF_LOCUS58868 [Hexamita inflata]